MENQIKVNLWAEQFLKELNAGSLTDFHANENGCLRMVNRRYDEIFHLLCEGKTIRVANLELINKTLSQALNDAENEDAQNQRISIFTSEDYKVQNKKFSDLLKKEDPLYMTFGLLDYYEDNRMLIKSAPLILMPIRLEKLSDQEAYQIRCVHHEVRLNDALVSRLMETRRIDISYPLENDFSLIEYLTYVATKVRNSHFSVNNGCFITALNTEVYYMHQDFITRKNEISALPLVKSVSYLNSEFFHLNKPVSMRLDHHFLSLLDLDNEEYKILKKIDLRENTVLKTNSVKNRHHLLINILYDFMLNNKNILITYGNETTHEELKSFIRDHRLEELTLDLSTESSVKEEIVEKLLNQEKLEFDVKLLDQNRIDETVDTYYRLKNNFKKLINALRKSNDPLQLSVNRAIYEYFALKDYPLLEVAIPNADLIDENKIREYTASIRAFVSSLENLKCNYQDHPFYGFINLTLSQEQYLELRDKIVALGAEFDPAVRAFDILKEKYYLPSPKNLREMKCVLNIVSMIVNCISFDDFWFETENVDSVLEELKQHNALFENELQMKAKIISIYEDKVFLIDHKELKSQLENRPLTRKILRSYQPYFMKKARIDETILSHLESELEEYYRVHEQVENLLEKYSVFKEFYHEGAFDIDRIKERFAEVKKFKAYCAYMKNSGEEYSYIEMKKLNEEQIKQLEIDRRKCQLAFNHMLNLINYLQKYFDPEISDFSTMPLIALNSRVSRAGKNFSSINSYLDFYLTYKKLNRVIPTLADHLLTYPQTEMFIPMFMKRFYYDYAKTLIGGNPLFRDYAKDTFSQSIGNYREYNAGRLEIIDALIKNNMKQNVQTNAIAMRSVEGPYLNALMNESIRILPLSYLLSNARTTVTTLFPVILMPVQEVSSLLLNQTYRFDLNIVMGDEAMLTRSALPGCSRADQTIVFDYRLLQQKDPDLLLRQSSENFVCSALQSLSSLSYVSSTYRANILNANTVDRPLKMHLADRLRKENFLVSTDVSTSLGTVDLLVKVPNSMRPTAILLDRLSYYSLEAAMESFQETEECIGHLGFACYRLITAIYFQDEEKEFSGLVDFITRNTVKEKNIQKVTRIRPLVEVLFQVYQDPEETYFRIRDKSIKSNTEVMKELLKECAPIRREDVLAVMGEEAVATLATLQMDGTVRIANGFVFLNDVPVSFRRVPKDSGYQRPLNTVSNEEIAEAIRQIVMQKSLPEDDVIKLILLCLGLKKMNHSHYFRVQNIIRELIEDRQVFIREGILYKEEQSGLSE